MTTSWKEPTKEELEELEARNKVIEVFANLGGRTTIYTSRRVNKEEDKNKKEKYEWLD